MEIKNYEEENEKIDDSEDILEFDIDDDIEDIIIEIEEEDIEIVQQEEEKIKIDEKIILSKHTLEDKHRLKYDIIFNGRKDNENENSETLSVYFSDTIQVDSSSVHWQESLNNENYVKDKRVKERIYEILSEKTDLNFNSNRRKPSKVDFNNYYYLLKTQLIDDNFTDIEIFNELAVYFSDNLFNMFKLLDNKWRNNIIKELQDHIGKQSYSKEVMNRNIYEGTEIEFLTKDIEDNEIHITGVVMECDYKNSTYIVDSYENIYQVDLGDIIQILNNTKFKNNLSKLDNIDFL